MVGGEHNISWGVYLRGEAVGLKLNRKGHKREKKRGIGKQESVESHRVRMQGTLEWNLATYYSA